MSTRYPKPGDLLRLDRRASIQFCDPITVRVKKVHDRSTYDGWVWLSVYQLNQRGDATMVRDLFVRLTGLTWLPGR